MTNFRLFPCATLLILAPLLITCGRREERAFFDAEMETSTAPVVSKAPRLPESAVRVKWGAAIVPPSLRPGGSATVSVTFINAGDKPWPDKITADPEHRDGANAVRLGYGWTAAEPEAVLERSSVRGDLPHVIQPGASVTLGIDVVAPAKPGDYQLTFDLVQELLFWFSDRGADVLTIPVKVRSGDVDASPSRTP